MTNDDIRIRYYKLMDIMNAITKPMCLCNDIVLPYAHSDSINLSLKHGKRIINSIDRKIDDSIKIMKERIVELEDLIKLEKEINNEHSA